MGAAFFGERGRKKEEGREKEEEEEEEGKEAAVGGEMKMQGFRTLRLRLTFLPRRKKVSKNRLRGALLKPRIKPRG